MVVEVVPLESDLDVLSWSGFKIAPNVEAGRPGSQNGIVASSICPQGEAAY
jgi:hypothetical protein